MTDDELNINKAGEEVIIPNAVVLASKHIDKRHGSEDKPVQVLVLGEYETVAGPDPKKMVAVTTLGERGTPNVMPVKREVMLHGGNAGEFTFRPFKQALAGVADLARNLIVPIDAKPGEIEKGASVPIPGVRDIRSYLAPIRVPSDYR